MDFPYLPAGIGRTVISGASTIVVCVDFVVGPDVCILQDMDNMAACCVFYVKVSTFTHLDQSKTAFLTVNQSGIVRLTVQHDLIVSVSFMYHPGDALRQTSADVLSLEQCPTYS